MNKSSAIFFCSAAIFLAGLPAWAGANSDSSVRSGTSEGAQVISRLERARHIDQMNAQGYNGGEHRDIGIFYYRKSQEVDAILNRLRQGDSVPMADVQKALDNSGAARIGESY